MDMGPKPAEKAKKQQVKLRTSARTAITNPPQTPGNDSQAPPAPPVVVEMDRALRVTELNEKLAGLTIDGDDFMAWFKVNFVKHIYPSPRRICVERLVLAGGKSMEKESQEEALDVCSAAPGTQVPHRDLQGLGCLDPQGPSMRAPPPHSAGGNTYNKLGPVARKRIKEKTAARQVASGINTLHGKAVDDAAAATLDTEGCLRPLAP
ncbi:hypothetical protein B0T20DRAFT_489387 [Sordaria brevicollis]|uniref:Uncharacterized protein n=1 Tax=Sordaria brevicollis TaxID=83679 RepID=A0AAE0P0W9_SORBR|nr:hypothetical protein B0T20DRAFT_489387 [Sordaria brevicollis]